MGFDALPRHHLKTVSGVAISLGVGSCCWLIHKRQHRPQFHRQKSMLIAGLLLPQSPRWHRNRLIFSDIWDQKVIAIDPITKASEMIAKVPGDRSEPERGPQGLGWQADGTMLVAQIQTRKLIAFVDSKSQAIFREHACLAALSPSAINDMVVASDGNAYVANFGMNFQSLASASPADWSFLIRPTCLIRVDAVGSPTIATSNELLCPNALAITVDQKVLLVSEYFSHRISAYERKPDGSLSNRFTWVDIPEGYPNGMCLDSSGALWVALCGSCEFVRISRAGSILEVIPASDGFMAVGVMLGGEDGQTLFMLEAKSLEALKIQWNGRQNAQIVTTNVDVPGVVSEDEPRYFAGYC